MGPPRRHHAPGGLPARPEGLRAGGPALGSGRLQDGHPARPQGQAGHPQHPPHPWRRVARPAAASARAGAQVAVRVHLGARRTLQHGRVRPHGRAGRRRRPSWPSRPTRTCCGTPAATRWPTRATTRAHYRPISGIELPVFHVLESVRSCIESDRDLARKINPCA